MKESVIARLRQAQNWCVRHGAPYEWLQELIADAIQELQSESGALWMQWTTHGGHVRIFVAGDFRVEDLDLLMEALTLSRDTLHRRELASAVDASETTDAGSTPTDGRGTTEQG